MLHFFTFVMGLKKKWFDIINVMTYTYTIFSQNWTSQMQKK